MPVVASGLGLGLAFGVHGFVVWKTSSWSISIAEKSDFEYML